MQSKYKTSKFETRVQIKDNGTDISQIVGDGMSFNPRTASNNMA